MIVAEPCWGSVRGSSSRGYNREVSRSGSSLYGVRVCAGTNAGYVEVQIRSRTTETGEVIDKFEVTLCRSGERDITLVQGRLDDEDITTIPRAGA